jgi:hypothetical protein
MFVFETAARRLITAKRAERPLEIQMPDRIKTTIRALLLGAAAGAAMGGSAFAQASASQPTEATGTIFQPILLAKNSDLSFGTVVRPISGTGTVTIAAADGQRALTGAGALLNTGPNAAAGRPRR